MRPWSRAVGLCALVGVVAAPLEARSATKAKKSSPRAVVARSKKPAASGPVSWCAPEAETIDASLCLLRGAPAKGPRTLVVFLHGMIAKNTDWQWTQQRALLRQAKASGFDALFPQAPLGPTGYKWPGGPAEVDAAEHGMTRAWWQARRHLERRAGQRYDQVFLMGFSSGAYFTSGLALRGKLPVDGYAVFAGGAGPRGPVRTPAVKPAVFVGICSKDAQTRDSARALAGELATRGFPHRAEERAVGHLFADAHVAHAVAYLRERSKGVSTAHATASPQPSEAVDDPLD